MPQMGGVELCRELRRKTYPGVILVLSGNVPVEARAELSELGVTGYLDKPVSLRQLSEVVQAVLSPAPS